MNSTFYNDGFNDAKNGLKFSPPDAYVYALEYKQGFTDYKL